MRCPVLVLVHAGLVGGRRNEHAAFDAWRLANRAMYAFGQKTSKRRPKGARMMFDEWHSIDADDEPAWLPHFRGMEPPDWERRVPRLSDLPPAKRWHRSALPSGVCIANTLTWSPDFLRGLEDPTVDHDKAVRLALEQHRSTHLASAYVVHF